MSTTDRQVLAAEKRLLPRTLKVTVTLSVDVDVAPTRESLMGAVGRAITTLATCAAVDGDWTRSPKMLSIVARRPEDDDTLKRVLREALDALPARVTP